METKDCEDMLKAKQILPLKVNRVVFHGVFRGSSHISLGPAIPYYFKVYSLWVAKPRPGLTAAQGLAAYRANSVSYSLDLPWIPHEIRL
jgi:hypothetical protein